MTRSPIHLTTFLQRPFSKLKIEPVRLKLTSTTVTQLVLVHIVYKLQNHLSNID